VVKTMAAIDQPPPVLGGLIGSALVGTFLGVFMAYGIVGPLAGRLKQVVDEEAQIYQVAKFTLIGHLKGMPVPLIIESARAAIDPQHLIVIAFAHGRIGPRLPGVQ